jgi:putative tricarboxylic transport membrane protein
LNRHDQISSLTLLVIAICMCIGSIRLTVGTVANPGPGFFPLLSGAVLGIFSLVLLVQSFKKRGQDENKPFWPSVWGGWKIFWVLLVLFAYVFGMNYVGFFLGTILFLGFLLRGMGHQKWLLTIIASLLGAIISYGIFQSWLDVQLPHGVFGF